MHYIRPFFTCSNRWIFSSLIAFAAVVALPALASADTFYADLDRDGKPDIITIATVPTPGLRVWLSGSNTSLLLPTRRPITHVTVSDIDGDGHVDLIASDTSARLHVWHRTHRGRLRPVHPRDPPLEASVSRGQMLDTASGDLPGAVLDDGSSAPVDTSHPARQVSLDVSGLAIATSSRTTDSHGARPPQPRGPPLG